MKRPASAAAGVDVPNDEGPPKPSKIQKITENDRSIPPFNLDETLNATFDQSITSPSQSKGQNFGASELTATLNETPTEETLTNDTQTFDMSIAE